MVLKEVDGSLNSDFLTLLYQENHNTIPLQPP